MRNEGTTLLGEQNKVIEYVPNRAWVFACGENTFQSRTHKCIQDKYINEVWSKQMIYAGGCSMVMGLQELVDNDPLNMENKTTASAKLQAYNDGWSGSSNGCIIN